MIYLLAHAFPEKFALFNLIRYLTFRCGAACLTSLVVSLWMGPGVIRWLKSVQRGGQPIREDGPARHLIEKKGTPTMGGILILTAMIFSTLLWADLLNGMSGQYCSAPSVMASWVPPMTISNFPAAIQRVSRHAVSCWCSLSSA
jgi:UDP-N-acetylmuramyl pentapeptide phosphotransferase/UDP-N-acetylglucosamine-1-phosphate transferase